MAKKNLPPKREIMFKIAPELKELCKPLLKLIEVDHFYYLHYPNQNTVIALTMGPKCTQYLIEHHLIPKGNELTAGIHYAPSNAASKARLQVADHFNVHHNLEFVQHNEKGIELFGFAVNNKHLEVINIYLNKLGEFTQFMNEFKNIAAPLLAQAATDPIQLKEQPLKQSKIFSHNKNMIKLNKRELEVLIALHEGCSAKETGKKLNLSYRTVEYYIANIKNKLNLSKTTSLAKFVSDHNLNSS